MKRTTTNCGAPPLAGAVLYAKDLERVVAFYAGVVLFTVRSAHEDHVVLTSRVFELVVLRIPAAIAESIVVETPPVRREETPIKLIFVVEALAAARRSAAALGGALNPDEQEWSFEGWRVCDGYDPEGNVFQVREAQEPRRTEVKRRLRRERRPGKQNPAATAR